MDQPLVILITLLGEGVVSYLLASLLSRALIYWFRMNKRGQPIRNEGVKSHKSKQGTPTMGGLAMVAATLITYFAFNWTQSFEIAGLLIIYVIFSLIGFTDDLLKIIGKGSHGLSAYVRIIIEISVVLVVFRFFPLAPLGVWQISLASLSKPITVGLLYIPFAFLVIVGSSNAFNITDGLDGLAAGISLFIIGPLILLALQQKNFPLASLLICQWGAVLGFLKWNFHPARIFMGDTGSLALGSLIGTTVILLRSEWFLFVAGFLLVVETMSVIIQVTTYQITRKRVFAMAPLHHHLEVNGWPEWRVIMFFWLLTTVFSAIALIIGGLQ